MSPNVGNFVHDLVEMAKAMETLPQVQAELEQARRDINNLSQDVQDRELAIQRYKANIEELNAKVRSLEVERDDASFRVMEAEDTQYNILAMAKAASISLEQMIRKLDPPKPEPEKPVEQPKAVTTEAKDARDSWNQPIPEGSSGPHPTEPSEPSTQMSGGEDGGKVSNPEQNVPDWKQDQAETSRLPQGQGEGNSTTTDANPTAETATASSGASSQEAASTHGEKSPYEGKKASDYPNWISYSEWIAGGGSDNSYYL